MLVVDVDSRCSQFQSSYCIASGTIFVMIMSIAALVSFISEVVSSRRKFYVVYERSIPSSHIDIFSTVEACDKAACGALRYWRRVLLGLYIRDLTYVLLFWVTNSSRAYSSLLFWTSSMFALAKLYIFLSLSKVRTEWKRFTIFLGRLVFVSVLH